MRRANLKLKALVRIYRRAFFEEAPVLNRFGIEIVDAIHANEAVILLALFGAAYLAFDHVAAAQLEAANLRLAYVDIVVADDITATPQEAVALGKDVEDPASHLHTRALLLGGEDRGDDLVLLHGRRIAERDFILLGDLDQFSLLLVFEIGRG